MGAPDRLAATTTAALGAITEALPAGEVRKGQIDMAEAVARSIINREHLVVEAGTGTGKTFAYLVPAILSGRKVVVATATKTLQDQLAGKDLPFLAEQLDHEFSFAVLKGRSNYICLQRVRELGHDGDQLTLEVGPRPPTEEIAALARWAGQTTTGDRAELTLEPSVRAWAAVSVGPRECPGATKCPKGDDCFTEKARSAAAAADVVVVNTHLYGMHLATQGAVLPEHDVVVIDEAHQLEDTIAATAGVELTSGRFLNMARATGAIVSDAELVQSLDELAGLWRDALADERGRRLRGHLDGEPARVLDLARARLDKAMTALRAVPDESVGDVAARKQRAMQAATSLIEDIESVRNVQVDEVSWVEGSEDFPVLRVAPVDVGEILDETLWSKTTTILTSATLPTALPDQVGLPDGTFVRLDVGSPFDYPHQAMLYCAAHMPDPRSAKFDEAVHDELEALITAAGGRTMALFTSYRALQLAVDALRPRLAVEVLAQDDYPKPALIERFTDNPETCLFATMGFWQGVDVPGATLSLVTIDRVPFPRPDDPLLQARREKARADAFRVVDLPRATTLLAQGAGRLIRSATDRGVVAVLDPRMAKASYKWDLVNALPPMKRTKDRSEVEAFLRSLRGDAPTDEA
jgi:ATP-dependent DNA helicase DinG